MGQYLDLDGLKKYNDRVKGYMKANYVSIADINNYINDSFNKQSSSSISNNKISYSKEECFTGLYWIDGRQILQKTIEWKAGNDQQLTEAVETLTPLKEGQQLISAQGYIKRPDFTIPFPSWLGNGRGYVVQDGQNIKLKYTKTQGEYIYYITIQYLNSKESNLYFEPRTEKPNVDNRYYFGDINPYYTSGYGMPNCTCYAYGRFLESQQKESCNLSRGNASSWYGNNDNYERGSIPRVGAIMCWNDGNLGHVAFVEAVTDDNNITITDSRWSNNRDDHSSGYYWRTRNLYKVNSNVGWSCYDWFGDSYKFQGFIYPPTGTFKNKTET